MLQGNRKSAKIGVNLMEDIKELSLIKETEREAREIEKELEQHPELDEIQVTEEMDAALFAKIQAYEKSKENAAQEDSVEFSEELIPEIPKDTDKTKKKTISYRKKGKKKYIIIGIAAVLVIVMSAGFVGVGNKAYWKEVTDKDYGQEALNVIKVEDMDDIQSEDGDKGTVFNRLEKDMGIAVVRLGYYPRNIEFLSVEFAENMQSARVFYKYEDEVIRYTIYLNSNDSERVENIEDEKVNEYTIQTINNKLEIDVKAYQVPNYKECRRIAEFEYKGIYYQLKGIMGKEEFDKMLKNLYFF